MAEKLGVAAALEALGPGEIEADAEPLVDLFGAAAPSGSSSVEPGNASGGRPRGARNRRTKEMTDYLLSRYTSPLEGLLATCALSPRALAEKLGLFERDEAGHATTRLKSGALLEAFKIQQAARVAAAPYLHQKQAIAIDTDGRGLGVLVLGDLDTEGAQSDELSFDVVDVEPNQQVSDATSDQSDAG